MSAPEPGNPMTEAEVAHLIDSAFENDVSGTQWKVDFPLRISYPSTHSYRRRASHVTSLQRHFLHRYWDQLAAGAIFSNLADEAVHGGLDIDIGHLEPVSEEQRRTHVNLEELVQELNDPRWEFRTIAGLARALAATETEVSRLLEDYPEVARWLPAYDEQGQQLIAPSRRSPTWKERRLRFRAYLAKSA